MIGNLRPANEQTDSRSAAQRNIETNLATDNFP